MAEYSATRRTPRKHKRVVMKGTEQFDADGVKLEPGDMQTDQQRQSDDDKRIGRRPIPLPTAQRP